MDKKELYIQKKQAQLDEWKADLAKLNAKASQASVEAKLKLNKTIDELDQKVEDGKTRLSALADTGEDAWESAKGGVESAWESMRSGFNDAAEKIRT